MFHEYEAEKSNNKTKEKKLEEELKVSILL